MSMKTYDLRGAKRVRVETPTKKVNPPTPPTKYRRTFSRRLLGEVLEACNLSTPVKFWPKGFWTARRNLYEECDEMKPVTPIKICPASPQDIFK